MNNKLNTAIKSSGVSQHQLSKLAGISQQQISRWVTGGRKPKLESLMKIAKALNKPLEELIDF